MKNKLKLLPLIVVFAACNQAKNGQQTQDETSASGNSQQKPVAEKQVATDNAIVGEWSQQFAVVDKNGNALLDPEERNGTKSTMGFNYFHFKDDGSCLYDSDMKFKGTYEIFEENGKRQLNVTVNGFGETYKNTIIDPVTDELVLYSSGAFMIFKKK